MGTFAIRDDEGGAVLDAVPIVWTGFPAFSGFHAARVGISEAIASNAGMYPDEPGEHEPLIELFNAGSSDVDLTGWTLSNAFSERRRWAFPSGTTLLGEGTIVVFADGETSQGSLHANFRLDAEGGEVILTAPDGATDGGLKYGPQGPGEAYAYSRTEERYVTTAPTPGAPPPELE